MSLTLQLTEQLIARPSVTPEDAGCFELLASRLEPLGFVCERMDSGPPHFHVCNLWANGLQRAPVKRKKLLKGEQKRWFSPAIPMWCRPAP